VAAGGQFSLREVSKKAEIAPTYLSKIEREELPPPSEDVIIRLATVLGEDADILLALGGKVSPDLLETICTHPKAFATLIRELRGRSEEAIAHATTVVRDGEW
jgi:transcriptional regulator with XRE-family HTH domain